MSSQEIAAVLTAKGVRPTQQRIAVYRYLIDHPIHPSADTIYRALSEVYPTFSRTTIYNSLRTLIEAGLVRSVLIEAEEQRFDGDPADHGHFKCTQCGRIYDFPLDTMLLHALCPKGYKAQRQDVYCIGICASCAGNENAAPLS